MYQRERALFDTSPAPNSLIKPITGHLSRTVPSFHRAEKRYDLMTENEEMRECVSLAHLCWVRYGRKGPRDWLSDVTVVAVAVAAAVGDRARLLGPPQPAQLCGPFSRRRRGLRCG